MYYFSSKKKCNDDDREKVDVAPNEHFIGKLKLEPRGALNFPLSIHNFGSLLLPAFTDGHMYIFQISYLLMMTLMCRPMQMNFWRLKHMARRSTIISGLNICLIHDIILYVQLNYLSFPTGLLYRRRNWLSRIQSQRKIFHWRKRTRLKFSMIYQCFFAHFILQKVEI